MMVNEYDATRWMIALQTDHSRMAGALAAHWGNDEFQRIDPYSSMVLAAQEHDSGWWEWELKPTLSDEGNPQDYISSIRNLGPGVWISMYQHGIDRLENVDPYAALIVQMHAEGLLTQGRGLLPYMPTFVDTAGAIEFLENGAQRRASIIQRLNHIDSMLTHTTDAALERNFRYMEVFDQFAQFLCNRYQMDHAVRTNGPNARLSDLDVPVRTGVADTRICISPVDAETAIVDPYPFNVQPFVIPLAARLVSKRHYADHDDFVDEFLGAEQIVVLRRLVAKGNSGP